MRGFAGASVTDHGLHTDGRFAFAPDHGSDTVSVIKVDTLRVLRAVPAGKTPLGILIR